MYLWNFFIPLARILVLALFISCVDYLPSPTRLSCLQCLPLSYMQHPVAELTPSLSP